MNRETTAHLRSVDDLTRVSGPLQEPSRKFVGIWQFDKPIERAWAEELLGPHIERHVFDGDRKVVLPNAILFDKHITRHSREYYQKFKGTNSILLHYLDETYEGGYERYCAFAGVIRWHWSSLFDDPSILVIPIGYREGPPSLNIRPLAARRYVWSFAGQVYKSSRPDMAAALSSIEPHFLIRTDKREDGSMLDRFVEADEYYDVMTDSMFAPCPMGNVNIECFRLYEALECGAVPIVEKRLYFDYYRKLLGDHPIPTISRWSDATHLIRDCLRNPEKLLGLQGECMAWWKSYKARLQHSVSDFLARTGSRPAPRDVTSKLLGHRTWQYLELLKHHDARALRRRVQRQVRRVLRDRKWRDRR
jgi:hypothetical protein